VQCHLFVETLFATPSERLDRPAVKSPCKQARVHLE
jgi:hypothetical protein